MSKRNKRVIAFTGAGISADSGIGTFMDNPDIRNALHRYVAQSDIPRYHQAIKTMKSQIDPAQPNDAHLALAEYDVEVITMNIDGLHEKAGSKPLNLHGTMPSDDELDICHTLYGKPVLYGDMAPNYQVAIERVYSLREGDVFLVIGASDSTAISTQLQVLASSQGADVIQIQSNAKTRVREVLQEILNA